MKIVGRILSCLCAFLLAVAILGSQLVIFANHAVKSQSFYIRPGESIRKDQLGEMQQLLDTLAETYGFDVASVSDEVNADAFARYGREVIGFLGSLLKEQEEEAELISVCRGISYAKAPAFRGVISCPCACGRSSRPDRS